VISGDDPRPFVHEVRQHGRHWSAAAARLGRRLFARAPQPAAHVSVVK
jgi:hypothetical protein